ncbi:MAG: N-acetylmuramoyl-L-alanine amidase [Magnetococcales bacterium]|nr:N-acetylmuramoyl-L-alanine amidase [Magnetococcales bacterium]
MDIKRAISLLIIHCAATPNGKDFSADTIRSWHTDPPPRGRGWSDIGYHFVIRPDGTVEPGRSLERVGAHAKGHNRHSIGICMVGTDRFTPAQWLALRVLVGGLEAMLDDVKVRGHRDLPKVRKSCPGFDVSSWLSGGMVPEEQHILGEK